MNRLLRHTPGSFALIRFTNRERIAIFIAPSGNVIAQVWFGIFRRRLFSWPRSSPKVLDRAIVFFMSGPDSDLPGETILELMVSRFLRECNSIADLVAFCDKIR